MPQLGLLWALPDCIWGVGVAEEESWLLMSEDREEEEEAAGLSRDEDADVDAELSGEEDVEACGALAVLFA